MTVNEFREKYPNLRIETNLKHLKVAETVKVGLLKTVSHPMECIMDARILTKKSEVNGASGEILSSGHYYNTKEVGFSDNKFLQDAEKIAIQNAIHNLITKKELK